MTAHNPTPPETPPKTGAMLTLLEEGECPGLTVPFTGELPGLLLPVPVLPGAVLDAGGVPAVGDVPGEEGVPTGDVPGEEGVPTGDVPGEATPEGDGAPDPVNIAFPVYINFTDVANDGNGPERLLLLTSTVFSDVNDVS
jgi:hypothetical protein